MEPTDTYDDLLRFQKEQERQREIARRLDRDATESFIWWLTGQLRSLRALFTR